MGFKDDSLSYVLSNPLPTAIFEKLKRKKKKERPVIPSDFRFWMSNFLYTRIMLFCFLQIYIFS